MFKKLAILVAALAVSAPAFADRGNHRGHGNGHGYGHGHRHVVVHKPHYVVHRPVVVHRTAVVHHYYRPAPAPVYVEQHVNPVAVLAGAVIGAAIVHHIATGY